MPKRDEDVRPYEPAPTFPRNPLRALHAHVRSLPLAAQLRECVDMLGHPELIAAELRAAFEAMRDFATRGALPPVEPADFDAVDLEELAREDFYATREVEVQGGPHLFFTCLANHFDPLGDLADAGSRRATLDYVGVSGETPHTPVLGAVQSKEDRSAYPLLLRGLACLAELASTSQLERLSRRLFGDALPLPPSFELDLVLEGGPARGERAALEQLTRDLAERIKTVIGADARYPRILGDVVCLRRGGAPFDGSLRFAWRV
jgi:hypothetical protein